MTGNKHDTGKPRLSLVLRHIGALTAAARVLEWGAERYGSEDNWRQVPDARARYREALGRHVVAWMAGEESDPDTGLPTLAHVLCNALFLMGLGEAAPQWQPAPVAASQWQPVETAPRDGTSVLLAYDESIIYGDQPRTRASRVSTFVWLDEYWRRNDGRAIRDAEVLGWMPLPTPPAVGGER